VVSSADDTVAAQKGEEEDTDSGLDAGQATNLLFSTKKPKNVIHGALSAGSNVLTGALGGAALMLGAPILGARQGMSDGGGMKGAAKGFAAGLGAGIVGGASMIVGGAATGAYQLGRGLYNTKDEINASMTGKDWDEDSREWVRSDLSKERSILDMSEADYQAVLDEEQREKEEKRAAKEARKSITTGGNGAADGQSESTTSTQNSKTASYRKVKETGLYDVLGVEPNATPGTVILTLTLTLKLKPDPTPNNPNPNPGAVKKAYYKKAKECHPDKNGGDPEANARCTCRSCSTLSNCSANTNSNSYPLSIQIFNPNF